MFFQKRKSYQLNKKQADATLQKVFEACQQPPNTIPFDKLLLRQKLNTCFYDCLIALTGILLLLTFLSPLMVSPVSSLLQEKEGHATLVSHTLEGDTLCLTLSGEGILYEEAYQETADGITEGALSYDQKTQTLCFTYYETETNIYIPLKNAPTLHLLLSPQ